MMVFNQVCYPFQQEFLKGLSSDLYCLSYNDTYADVHFQQREYDHDGGQDGQSDVMFNIDPDIHFHASIPTYTKYYNDEQFVRDVKSVSDLSFIHFKGRPNPN